MCGIDVRFHGKLESNRHISVENTLVQIQRDLPVRPWMRIAMAGESKKAMVRMARPCS